jgi:acyl-CoA synthetase (AMP-forming)/AMP-acid ligase II
MLPRVDMLIGDIVRRNAEVVPDAVAASLGAHTLTYAQLDGAANRLAAVLAALGVGHGDRVVSWADTALDVLPLFVACANLGAIFAPLNARYGLEEATPVALMARPKLFVADAARAEAAAELIRDSGISQLGRIGGRDGRGAPAGPGHDLSMTTLGTGGAAPHTPALRESDPHVLFCTSGSTGRPKGVLLSHRASYLRGFQGVFRDVPERSVCMFPLFHMAGFTLAIAAWQTRGEIALVESASAEGLLGAVERRRANRLYAIPAVWARVLATEPGKWDTSSLTEADTGTSAVPIELVRALKERFPHSVTRIYYGSTECGAGTALADADVLRKPGSVGPPAPGVDLRLGRDGEIQLRSAYLFDGYFDDADATASALRDGWYHSGDLGELDGEGYLHVIGRVSELIRTGGESVVPTEVEEVLARHPDVAEVAVIGVPDASWGEVVCAVVVPRAGATPDLESIQRHCDAQLAGYKKPRRLETVAALPRTAATGQVQRALLREQIQSR